MSVSWSGTKPGTFVNNSTVEPVSAGNLNSIVGTIDKIAVGGKDSGVDSDTLQGIGVEGFATPSNESLTNFYSFDSIIGLSSELLLDESGLNSNGTAYNVTPVKGIVAMAGSFNGTSSCASGGYTNSSTFTLSIWFKGSTSLNKPLFLLKRANNATKIGIYINAGYAQVKFLNSDSVEQSITDTSILINDNYFHNIVAVHTGSTCYLYVDGKLVSSLTQSLSTLYYNQWTIGCGDELTTSTFTEGVFDDARIYNSSLNSNQIYGLYHTKISTKANLITSLNQPNSHVFRDSSGNFSAGTITATLSGNATSLTSLTSSITELNYCDGVTSSIQTQLNNKLAISQYTAADVTAKVTSIIGNTPIPQDPLTDAQVPGAPFSDVTILLKNDYRKKIEDASGGRCTVLYDVGKNPSIMAIVPKTTIEDLFGTTAYGSGVYPAFIRNGVEKSTLYFPLFDAYNNGGYPCSLPGRLSWTAIDYDTALAACAAKNKSGDTGWHMASIWDFALFKLWCCRNGYQPRGNTYYGRAHDATWENGVRNDRAAPGLTTGDPRILTGAGPNSWRHDGSPFGVDGLVGNVWKWMSGMKIIDGQICLPSTRDNYYDQAESSWTGTGVYFDSTGSTGTDDVATLNGAPVLSGARTTPSDDCGNGLGASAPDKDYTQIDGESGARSVTMSATYDALPLATRQLMMQLFVAHKINGAGSAPFAGKGGMYVRNYGERMPLAGGAWYTGASAGLAALSLNSRRSYVDSYVGFRPAFLS